MNTPKKVTAENIHELKDVYAGVLNSYEIKCKCGSKLESEYLRYYKYPKSNEMWLYVHCTKCGYDYSYPKIFTQYFRLLKEKWRNLLS